MRVAVFPSDNSGCGWYRLRHPARVLAAHGHDVEVHGAESVGPRMRQNRRRRTVLQDGQRVELDTLESVEIDADVIVFQRCTHPEQIEVLAAAKAQGIGVVVDVDDDLDALHPHHPYLETVGKPGGERHRHYLHDACRLADVVTCTTPALADRYGYGHAVVLPNLVPEQYLKIKPTRSKRVQQVLSVGWTGRPISHIGDARLLQGVGQVALQHRARFSAWGESAPRTFLEAGIPKQVQHRVPYRELTKGYPLQVAKLDVGLVPLVDSEFNRAKSWLKGMEYAALGVPFVASPTPEYRRLAKLGAGLLAHDGQQWRETVGSLLADEKLRQEHTERGRAVAATLTYELHAERWWNAWTRPTLDAVSSGRLVSRA